MAAPSTGSIGVAHPFLDHVEHGCMHWTIELHARNPVLHPANATLKGFDARKRNPDRILRGHSNGEFDAAALW